MTYRNPPKGFSLVETMVAITILALALVGPFIAVRNALQGSYVARDQLVASMLAQEAMEYLRNVRDNNYLSGRDWLDGFSSPVRDGCYGVSPSQVCVVDPTRGDFHGDSSGMLEADSIATAAPLRLSSANLYNQQAVSATNNATKFTRTVVLQSLSATEVRVTVTVSWISAGQPYTAVVTDVLRDWL